MKGLLLKDWYMMKSYCRVYLLITIIFLMVSCMNENKFYVFYPCLLCGMIPVNLLSHDERSGWIQYSSTLPYTKMQFVSSKYLIGLFSLLAVITVTGILQAVKMNVVDGGLAISEYVITLLLMCVITTTCLSLCLPFVFLLGVEKGRIVYFVMIGIFFAGIAIATRLPIGVSESGFTPGLLLAGSVLFGIAICALSWYLSVVFYRKREL